MNYPHYTSELLTPKIDKTLPLVIDLFAGCGGLSLGFEACGFETIGYELDLDASNSYNANLLGKCIQKELKVGGSYPEADIIVGGPPCQPFSVRGKQKGLKDSRDGFPIFLDAVKQVKPEICLFENVRGMLYKNQKYLDEILISLENMGYNVYFKILNAKNYGVPQNRERIIVVGSKNKFAFPDPVENNLTAGDAINDIKDLPANKKLFLTSSMDAYIKKYELASKCVNPRDLHLDKPARTLTCRNLAGATSDMHRIKVKNGARRMLTVREAARLQSFPDWFRFSGSEGSQYKQIGNAVAPIFGLHIAKQIKKYCVNNGLNYENSKFAYQEELFNV
jgi:DNA (cytosine-5)-methyltransferase 1